MLNLISLLDVEMSVRAKESDVSSWALQCGLYDAILQVLSRLSENWESRARHPGIFLLGSPASVRSIDASAWPACVKCGVSQRRLQIGSKPAIEAADAIESLPREAT